MTRPEGEPEPTDPEDIKMIGLARSALARNHALDACCVRDTDGRSYVGTAVDLEHLQLSGVQVALGMAVSSGAQGLEAVAVLGDHDPTREEGFAISEIGGHQHSHRAAAIRVWLCDTDGVVRPPSQPGWPTTGEAL